ncbi:hypothetical protein TRFO_02118 [Tritrichomonas foetus]|uniref:Crossover junction endonuclease MUS81 n=1 Tax=Tritrichomonas foetus TaxID=1144522 RepID=A0A1J4JCP9_9EUKA|nr:hypothetical protein TRFO_02118 [Tritrichomonas foetus]|eukprot:OHS95189.1 hypothetical protein TRFO_02118 [Tritrichomonas foetus]
MERNKSLISFLQKKANKLNQAKRDAIKIVIQNIKKCPLVLDLDDSQDIIGVNDDILPLLQEFFSEPSDHYVPKDGTIARKMLGILHKEYPKGLQKSDIERFLGNRPPPTNGFNQHKQFYGSWASMKTLTSHGLVEKTRGRCVIFTLTEKGLELANQLFGTRLNQPSHESSITLFVSKSEIECRVSINVPEILKRTKMTWKEKVLPIGSLWFVKDDQVFDVIIQFSSLSAAGDEYVRKKISCSPFSTKILIVIAKENPNNPNNCEMKIRMNLDYGINLVFLESIPSISSYLVSLAKVLEIKNKTIGSFDEVSKRCSEQRYANTIVNIWKEQLKLVPGVGPHFAANIAAQYGTPHQLIDAFESYTNPSEDFCNAISTRWGKRPRQNTTKALIDLFSYSIGNLNI